MSNSWSRNEERFLARFYENTPNDLLAYALDRPTDAVRKKANRMGFWKNGKPSGNLFVNETGRHYSIDTATRSL